MGKKLDDISIGGGGFKAVTQSPKIEEPEKPRRTPPQETWTTTIRFPVETGRHLRMVAAHRNENISTIVVNALQRYLKEECQDIIK